MVDVVPPAGDGAGSLAGPGLTVAMHMSDGLVNAPTSAAFGLVAVLGLAFAVEPGARPTSTTARRRWPASSPRSSSPSR